MSACALPTTVPVQLPVALNTPLTFAVPENLSLSPGDFVSVPVLKRTELGVVWYGKPHTVAPEKLRFVKERFDQQPLDERMLAFVTWVAKYTLSPTGLVLRMVLPIRDPFRPPSAVPKFQRAADREQEFHSSQARKSVFRALSDLPADQGLTRREIVEQAEVSPGTIQRMIEARLLLSLRDCTPISLRHQAHVSQRPILNTEQTTCADAILKSPHEKHQVFVLDGVTGSGKTETYFHIALEILHRKKQVLILLPEISLTAMVIERFHKYFGTEPLVWHSGISEGKKRTIWREAYLGLPMIVVGARSALFLPFRKLKLIVVDEEHDPSYKQEDRVIYHARDMAILRASIDSIPIVLASATVSLDSWSNIVANRYKHLQLRHRFSNASMPRVHLIDLTKQPVGAGSWIAKVLREAITERLKRNEQSMLFLNRRGFAPLTVCRSCGYHFGCINCSSWLVEHRKTRQLRCHFCSFRIPRPTLCPECSVSDQLIPCGPGVERIALEVAEIFPEARLRVLSSDASPQNMRSLRADLEAIRKGEVDIVVGTQIIAKGHDFPRLTLVGVVDGDCPAGIGDPRERERLFQLLHQVIGRAGRAAWPGEAYIQTHNPDQPVHRAILAGDRQQFIEGELKIRKQHQLPPFSRLAAIVVSAPGEPTVANAWAVHMRKCIPDVEGFKVLGPADAPVFRIRQHYRKRFLIQSSRSMNIQKFVRRWLEAIGKCPGQITIRVDIDPVNFM